MTRGETPLAVRPFIIDKKAFVAPELGSVEFRIYATFISIDISIIEDTFSSMI